jgi:hypothetical protein
MFLGFQRGALFCQKRFLEAPCKRKILFALQHFWA